MFEVVLVYKPCSYRDRDGVPVARTDDPEAVEAAKRAIIREALKEAAMWQQIDHGCYQMALGELERLKRIFEAAEGQQSLAS